MNLEAALVARLATIAPNLYPMEAPKNYTTPCVVYNRLTTKPVGDLSPGYEAAWIHEQISVFDPSYQSAINLAQTILAGLTTWSDDEVQAVIWDNEEHMVDQTTDKLLYHVALRFIIMANLSA